MVFKEIQDVRRHHKYRHEELRRDLKLGENQRLFGPLVNVMPLITGLTLLEIVVLHIIYQQDLSMIYR